MWTEETAEVSEPEPLKHCTHSPKCRPQMSPRSHAALLDAPPRRGRTSRDFGLRGREAPVTRVTLLTRIKDGADAEAWREFVRLYGPVVYGFARKRGLQDA